MKILLVQCPVYDVEMPPLGLAYLAACVDRAKFSVEILDINIDFFHAYPQYKKFWKQENYKYCAPPDFFLKNEELEEIVNLYANKILKTGADIIGFSIQTTSSALSTYLSAKIKKIDPTKIIIFGGPECTREEDPGYFFMKPGKADYLVLGEGEVTFGEMLEKVHQKKTLEQCRGLLFCRDEKVFATGARDLVNNLDVLPFPDFSLFPLDKYLHKNSLPIVLSRGCINKCCFCVDRRYQGRYRNRSRNKVLEEILQLYKKYSLRRMKFNDLLINGNLGLLEDLCDALIDLEIGDLFWSGNMLVRANMPKYIYQKMYKAGCRSITFGIESASTGVLKSMDKSFSTNDIARNLKYAAKSGIHISTNWIVGFPGETRQDLFETMKFIVRNKKYIYEASAANKLELLRGSDLYQDYREFGIEFYSQQKWRRGENDEVERIFRENTFNQFLKKIGILNDTRNSEDAYEKKYIGWLGIERILRQLKTTIKNN